MRAALLVSAIVFAGCAARAPSPAGSVAEIRVRGEVVDSWCWSIEEKRGPEHATCARNCLANGNPPVLVADDGTAWLLVPAYDHIPVLEAAKKRAGETVTVTGTPRERGGMKVLAIRVLE